MPFLNQGGEKIGWLAGPKSQAQPHDKPNQRMHLTGAGAGRVGELAQNRVSASANLAGPTHEREGLRSR